MMAEQMVKMEGKSGLGPTLNTILIDDRNEACMRELEKQRKAGKKRIAIFYGAAHMPDFEKRLIENHGMQKQGTVWLTAWDLRLREINPLELLLKLSR